MKLRMRSNSLRLRLTRSEVAQLAEQGSVEERIEFVNDSALIYELESWRNLDHVVALYENGRIMVRLPEAMAQEWAATDQVGIEAEVGPLTVLIEKDFQCAHGEKDPDAYEGGGGD
ncbi:MAG: hypothetical protein JWO80_1355 [Bryobacterales bacterium]|nr:hypothetical protein [Bryobacterales bacterium]